MTQNEKKIKFFWIAAAACALLFIFIIIAVKLIDVAPIGPLGSSIGMSSVNRAIRNLLGRNQLAYTVSEICGFAAIGTMLGFAVVGLVQWIQRKSIKKVDADILLLAALYIVMAAFYVLFELVVVNYRPVLEDGALAASFPSSHTMLAVVAMGSAVYQFAKRIKTNDLWIIPTSAFTLVMIVIVECRFLSGMHWFTDILAGVFLGGALVLSYVAICFTLKKDK